MVKVTTHMYHTVVLFLSLLGGEGVLHSSDLQGPQSGLP